MEPKSGLVGQGVPVVPRADTHGKETVADAQDYSYNSIYLVWTSQDRNWKDVGTISLWLETAHTQMIKLLSSCSRFKISPALKSYTIIVLRN